MNENLWVSEDTRLYILHDASFFGKKFARRAIELLSLLQVGRGRAQREKGM
ncbi:hypothetical protein QUB33_23850 [Microcoleus sp. B3-A4]|uniref:hypothetical protein n=1 Tax=Microcoleus sp. B3-A4 TaxID=2818653 RepID=UPI002FCFEC9C